MYFVRNPGWHLQHLTQVSDGPQGEHLHRYPSPHSAFIVSYEIAINVYAPDNIGELIDSYLKLEDLTLKGFEWKPLEVILHPLRKKILRKKPSRPDSKKEKVSARRSA
jgi:hypothetical protein